MVNNDVLSEIAETIGNNPNGEAKYRRLERAINSAILTGRLKGNQQLPADKVFADILGLSLGTVQKALNNLKGQGILRRSPKKGTVISDHSVHEDDVFMFRFRDPVTQTLITPEVKMLSIEEVPEKGSWSDFIKSERIICFERMLRIDMEPPVYSQVYVSHDLAKSWLDCSPQEFHGLSIHRYLHCECNQPILRTENKVQIGAFEESARYRLMAEEGTLGLIWDIYGYSYEDAPCTFQRIQLPKEHRPIEFRRSLTDNN